jgi:ABC-type molybdenum transport system ATPase subunit/photorepair protein PhrA
MLFSVISSLTEISKTTCPKGFLLRSDWDDWFEFSTLFGLYIIDDAGQTHELGNVKIGQFGMLEAQRSPKLPSDFEVLDNSFFSLGQGDDYYEGLRKLDDSLQQAILGGLHDLANDETLFERALNERVTRISLLRFVAPISVRGQFRRIITGGARLSRYDFSYHPPQQDTPLTFEVKPESCPPTNIHVLIGRNGVGKTHLLNQMTRALIGTAAASEKVGYFRTSDGIVNSNELFANFVSVTFSAFDNFEPLAEVKDKTVGIKYSYVGLKPDREENDQLGPKTPTMLRAEFVKSLNSCRQGSKRNRWQRSMGMLETDPKFKEAEVSDLLSSLQDPMLEQKAQKIFDKLSSGHKIILLTMTRLVETVEERTLVLLDEPEAHLHPPLLSAFIRALSDLLVYRNGVAIIATHSPVVLQEVPRNCVWKLRRTGSESCLEKPEIETFGENVGVLTREIFGLEVTQSGFHKLLKEVLEENNGINYDSALNLFDNQLGAEARAILQALIMIRDQDF